MSEKLCVFCKHFDWTEINYRYYSTLTGGDLVGGMGCSKKHYADEKPWHTKDFREIILRAEKCADYTPPTKEAA